MYKVERGLGKKADTGWTMMIPKKEKEIGIVGRCGILLLSPVGEPLARPPKKNADKLTISLGWLLWQLYAKDLIHGGPHVCRM